MAALSLTTQERLRIAATFAAIENAQKPDAKGKFRRARSGREDEIAAVGISRADQASARALGATLEVDEYAGPRGCGWFATVRLVRGGVTWEMRHHVGPETHLASDWVVCDRKLVD